ncbi:MAG: FecR family protein [Macellibacteroides fermentans]|uniref:FecR family protein n=1 Tax=Macellibacteroides fermentans TaxID=879969 RepID=UPI003ACF1ED4
MNVDRHVLIRYFLGQSTEEEKEAIRQWLENDPANKQQFVSERIRFDASVIVNENEIRPVERQGIHPYILIGMKIAASFLILLSSIYLYDSYRMETLSTTYQAIRVPAGNRTNLVLPDGTEVWLNSNTSLKYPLAFTRDRREVILDGEAYFDVVKGSKPFIVKTDKYNVEVLGTTFNVEAYSKEPGFKTALFSGKVKLFNRNCNDDNTYLEPGQTADLVNGKLQVSSTKDLDVYRWRDGLIYIENKSFEEIMKLFEKYYNVRIEIRNNKVKSLGYKGKMRVSDGVNHGLNVLQNDFPFTYERDEDTNIIYIY